MQKNMWKIFCKETLQIVVPELLRETGYVQKNVLCNKNTFKIKYVTVNSLYSLSFCQTLKDPLHF